MANYRIPKDVTTELKLNKHLYLIDLFIIIGCLMFGFVMGNVIHSPLTWYFYGFMAVVAGLLIIRPSTNPKKRLYEVIYLSMRRRKDTYSPIDYEINEEDLEEEGDS